jgi:hypothetical protein
MDTRKPTSERIRPILEAMERSIDRARRQRTGSSPQQPDQSQRPSPPVSGYSSSQQPAPQVNPVRYAAPSAANPGPSDSQVPRSPDGTPLKARPKRPQNVYPPPLSSPYRSAG